MNIDVVLFFQSIRTPVLDALVMAVTRLGEQVVLVAGVCVLYWCVDKRLARFILINLFVGGMLNALLKITFCVPRPWLLDARVVPVGVSVHAASGYSFPSGHTAAATAVYGALAVWFVRPGRRWVCWAAALLISLVAVSRLYLGVHTPADVLTSMALGAMLLALSVKLTPWIEKHGATTLCAGLALGVALALYALTRPGAELTLDAFATGGACCGLFAGWFFEGRWVRFRTRARPLAQICKCLIGMAMVGGLMLAPWPFALMEARLAVFIRYLLLALVAVGVCPWLFSRIWRETT